MKKLFTLMTLLVAIVTGAWAETETPGKTGTTDADVTGTSFSIAGTYVAGTGGVSVTPMGSQGIKLRSNKTSNTLVVSVAAGYQIDALTVYGVTNDNSKTVTVDAISVDGVNYSTDDIVIPNKKASTAATISITGIAATDNITFTFSDGAGTQLVWDFHFTYTQTEVIVKEITAVSINGSDISDDDLATLKSTKALTIDGSSLNGSGALNVTLNTGATTVSKANDGDDVEYTFSVDEDDYTVTVTDVAKTYSAEGSIVYYKKGDTEATGVNTNTVTANGITFSMVDTEKTFQYGTGAATISGDAYTPLKLSTGSGVNVTFPDGKVATKVIIYGWSASGNGAINSIGETSVSTGDKSIDTSADIFYATNTSTDIYPSVYEYDLNGWESFYFNPGGSSSQPFVVMDFVFADGVVATNAAGWTSYTPAQNATLSDGATAYIVTAVDGENKKVTVKSVDVLKAGEGYFINGTASTPYTVTFTDADADDVTGNLLKGCTSNTEITGGAPYKYVLGTQNGIAGLYYIGATAVTIPAGKCYLQTPLTSEPVSLSIDFGEVTAVQNVEAAPVANEAQVGQKAFVNGHLVIFTEKGYVNAIGQTVK